jgi:hypothetical protein
MQDSPAALLVDQNNHEIIFILDGVAYRIPVVSKIAKGSDGSLIDPATEGGNLATLAGKDFATQTTLAAVKAKTDNLPSDPAREGGNLSTLAGKDFATQTTLAAIKAKTDNVPTDPAREGGNLSTLAGKDFATQTTLLAIKNTDGIKKIVDPLPAGTNVLGGMTIKVLNPDLSTVDWKTLGSQVPGVTVFDLNGIPVNFGAAPVPANPTLLLADMVKNGSSSDLRVNGATTPVVFTFNADATKNLYISDIEFVLVASSLVFGSDKFAGLTVLTNGVLVEIIADSGKTSTLATLKVNEDFMFFATAGGWDMMIANKDIIRSGYTVGGAMTLKAGTADKIRVTVRDNLSSGIDFFKCQVRAVKQE